MKQITAKHCAKIRPFPPDQRGYVRPPNIIFVKAVLYVMENGRKRQALPKRFGSWSVVHARFRRALLEQEAVGDEVFCFGLNSTSVKAHPDGAGARKTSGSQASASRAADGVRRSA